MRRAACACRAPAPCRLSVCLSAALIKCVTAALLSPRAQQSLDGLANLDCIFVYVCSVALGLKGLDDSSRLPRKGCWRCRAAHAAYMQKVRAEGGATQESTKRPSRLPAAAGKTGPAAGASHAADKHVKLLWDWVSDLMSRTEGHVLQIRVRCHSPRPLR